MPVSKAFAKGMETIEGAFPQVLSHLVSARWRSIGLAHKGQERVHPFSAQVKCALDRVA